MNYRNDPLKFKLRYSTNCKYCGSHLNRSDLVFYWPATKTIKCLSCGEEDYKQFLSAAADEQVLAGTGNPYAN